MPVRAVPAAKVPEAAMLSHEDMSAFTHALTAARGQFTNATKALCVEFALGPRGPWIIGLVGRDPIAPHELASFFNVGRSLITAELNKLIEAGLIAHEKDATDGRRVALSLTTAGRKVYDRLGEDLDTFLTQRLSTYSREEVMLCTRLLSDFATGGGRAA